MESVEYKIRFVNVNRDRRLTALLVFLFGIFIISRAADSEMQILIFSTTFTVFVVGLATIRPETFDLPLRLWMKMGRGIGKIVSPVTLGIVYFIVLCPIAFVLRFLLNRDLMMLGNRESTWIGSEEKNSEDFFERMY